MLEARLWRGYAFLEAKKFSRASEDFACAAALWPDLVEAALLKAEGLVEIPTAFFERVEAEARKVTIEPEKKIPAKASEQLPAPEKDRPNYPALVEKVRLRDGQICANPGCRKRGHCHVHLLQFRAHGDRTVVYNEILLCRTCHAGLLKLGYSRENARKRLEKAWKARSERLDPSSAPAEDEILLEAIRASPS